MTTAQTEIASKITNAKVGRVSEWKDRVYIQPTGYAASFRGCATHKLWVGADGTINNQRGKGSYPRDYSAACDVLTDLLGVDIRP